MIKLLRHFVITILIFSSMNLIASESLFRLNPTIENSYFKNCININQETSSEFAGQYICYPSNGRTPLEAQKIIQTRLDQESWGFTEFFEVHAKALAIACELSFIEELKKHSLMKGGSYSIAFSKEVIKPRVIANVNPNHFSGK